MKPMRFLTILLLSAGLGLAAVSGARAQIVEGRDYTVLPEPRPTESGKNIDHRYRVEVNPELAKVTVTIPKVEASR